MLASLLAMPLLTIKILNLWYGTDTNAWDLDRKIAFSGHSSLDIEHCHRSCVQPPVLVVFLIGFVIATCHETRLNAPAMKATGSGPFCAMNSG